VALEGISRVLTCNNDVSQEITRTAPINATLQAIALLNVANNAASDRIVLIACNETSDGILLLRVAMKAVSDGIALVRVARRAVLAVTTLALVCSKDASVSIARVLD